MFKKLFKREFTNENYTQELLKDHHNYKWLEEGLDTKLIDINYQNNKNDTFLMVCLKRNKYDAALWLLKMGADPTIKNNEYKTAIDIAIEKSKTDIVEQLIQHEKLNVNQKDEYGRSLLQNIIISGNFTMAKTLIKGGADINTLDNKGRHILYDALAYGDLTFVHHLLTYKNIELNDFDEDGNTLLQHPQAEQNDMLAKDLLVAGCDPTALNAKGESYLFNTVMRGAEAEEIVQIALKYGANVNERTLSKNTIMMELVLEASKLINKDERKKESLLRSVVKMLNYGGDINALDAKGETGLFNAVKIRDVELIAFLLKAGIDPNIQNPQGETVLEFLLYDAMEYSQIIKILLVYKIEPKLKNKHGQNAYEVLTNIILHLAESVVIKDTHLVSLIDPDGLYMNVVQLLLDNEKEEEGEKYILEVLDSSDDPLFFKPLMNDNFALFSLYTKYNINLHMLNKKGHNIFFSYVLRVFENNKDSSLICKNFQENISSLISRKVDKDFKDSLGWTILHKVLSTQCNIKLFNILVKTVRFDYSITDNLGRSVIHNAVWSDKQDVIKIVHKVSPSTINIEDIYGIPPIYYAALLGSKELVKIFFELGANINSLSKIDPKAIKKFKPMLKNLKILTEEIEDLSVLQRNESLIEQIEKKFTVS